jgi:hypothetical protein
VLNQGKGPAPRHRQRQWNGIDQQRDPRAGSSWLSDAPITTPIGYIPGLDGDPIGLRRIVPTTGEPLCNGEASCLP